VTMIGALSGLGSVDMVVHGHLSGSGRVKCCVVVRVSALGMECSMYQWVINMWL